jgi:hypothetical protein
VTLLVRTQGGRTEFSVDGQQVLFAIDAARFAHIPHLCADGDHVIATAAESAADVADVSASRRGNYRAWRIGAGVERCLTREYTNTAIPLPGPDEALAYSNGTHLVLLEGGRRRAFKTGAFNWGPVSLSVDPAGRRVAMTKWRGDYRKLFWLERDAGTTGLSAFSYFSYLLTDDTCCFCNQHAIKRFQFADASLITLTHTRFVARLLAALGYDTAASARAEVELHWSGLGWLGDRLVAAVRVVRPPDYVQQANALISFVPNDDASDVKLLEPDLGPWSAQAFIGNRATLQVLLERYVEGRVVGTRRLALGAQAQALQHGWELVGDARHPEAGSAFLPG